MNGFALIDAIVAGLLVATCAHCFVLARRLKTLKEGQTALHAAIAAFDAATRRAERNLERMESAGVGYERDFDALLARGDALASELSVMVSAGENIAGRLEGAADEVRRAAGRTGAGA